MKKLVTKLNNFRLTALIESIIQLLVGLVSLGFLFAYSYAGQDNGKYIEPAFPYKDGDMTPQFLGMIFFVSAIFSLILAGYVIYSLFKPLMNKETYVPKKAILVAGKVNILLQAIVDVLTIVLIVGSYTGMFPVPKTLVLFIVLFVLSIISIVFMCLSIYPLKKCEYYQPPIKKK